MLKIFPLLATEPVIPTPVGNWMISSEYASYPLSAGTSEYSSLVYSFTKTILALENPKNAGNVLSTELAISLCVRAPHKAFVISQIYPKYYILCLALEYAKTRSKAVAAADARICIIDSSSLVNPLFRVATAFFACNYITTATYIPIMTGTQRQDRLRIYGYSTVNYGSLIVV